MQYFTTVFLAVLTVASSTIASPYNNTARDDLTCVYCGTTDDATLSDCQQLVQPDTWNAVWAGGSNVCHWSNWKPGNWNNEAYNVGCYQNCCAYYSPYPGRPATLDRESIRQRAASIMGCGDGDINRINGLEIARADRSGVCLSNGSGCGDCFDDNDFSTSCD